MAVHTTDGWSEHIKQLEQYFIVIRQSGLTLNLNKAKLAQREIKFVGHVIGSGKRRADPDKVAAIRARKSPESKRQVRQVMGLFSHFREYIPSFADLARPLTDLTSKRFANRIPWGEREQVAFERLKQLLIDATERPINVIDSSRPFCILVDASHYASAVSWLKLMPGASSIQ